MNNFLNPSKNGKISILIFFLLFLNSATKTNAQWGELGGTNNSIFNGSINSIIANSKGNLYSAGNSQNGNGKYYVGNWNGSSWSELGGINSSIFNGAINCLATDISGNLYAAGAFTDTLSGDLYVAKWNGSNWQELGGGLGFFSFQNNIFSISIDGKGNVYAAGDFGYVAKWDGSSWSELGGTNNSTFNGAIKSLTTDSKGNLYAAGESTDGNGNCYVGKWNGSSWNELIGNNKFTLNGGTILCIKSDPFDNIYAAGDFGDQNYSIHGIFRTYIAKWNGSNWSEIGDSMGSIFNNHVNSVTTDAFGNIYAAGGFSDNYVQSYLGNDYVAKWNGSSWGELGGTNSLTNNKDINSLTTDANGNVYAAGVLSNAYGNYYVAKYKPLNLMITSFFPITGASGKIVTIKGIGFTGATAVSFGGDTAASFNVVNDSTITAILGNGASGRILVNVSGVTDSLDGFTYEYPPTITSFTPNGKCAGTITTVTIFGTNFTGASSVNFGSTPASSIIVNSANMITATAPRSVTTGNITVTTSGGIATSHKNFTIGNSYTAYAYVANGGDDTVSVINLVTNTVVAKISVGIVPNLVCISPDGMKAYVTNYGGYVSLIKTSTNTVTATVAEYLVNAPSGVCFSPDGTKAYVANEGDNTVTVINASNDTVITRVIVGNAPLGICVSPDGSKVYVTNRDDGSLSVINAVNNTVTTTLYFNYGDIPYGISVSPDGSKVYVSIGEENSVYIINSATNTINAKILVGNTPTGVSVSPDGTKLYVVNEMDNTVSVINTATNKIITTVAVGSNPYGVSVNPDGTKVYVTNVVSNNVSVINTSTNTVTATLPVGKNPWSLGYFIGNVPTVCGGSTPVTISNIDVAYRNDIIEVNWSTANELNTRHFIIQHSTDGSSFTDIVTVKAIGSGANGYQFTDNNPANGINYYRLQSVDKDGSSSYSKVVSVNFGDKQSFSIIPNPAKDFATISFCKTVDKATIAVFDITGKAVISQLLNGSTSKYKLNTQSLKSGLYVIKVNTTTSSFNEKLLINK